LEPNTDDRKPPDEEEEEEDEVAVMASCLTFSAASCATQSAFFSKDILAGGLVLYSAMALGSVRPIVSPVTVGAPRPMAPCVTWLAPARPGTMLALSTVEWTP